MAGQIGFWDVEDRLSQLSRHGDPLEKLSVTVDFESLVTDAAAHDGARLREGLIAPSNTASDVWADSAYRSAENERFLKGVSKTSRIHRRKP
ncbi:hypothetical protein VQ042_17055, partial [Aurantimonas sp. A2-1-M11]